MKRLICLLIPLLFFGCAKKQDSLRVAATSVPHSEMLEQVKGDLKQQNITLEIIVIDDYLTPNRSLSYREVDANFFQHEPFLEEQINEFGYPLVNFGAIHLEPMGIYSKKISSFSDLPSRPLVAIPSDPSNLGRALYLLEQNGLISLNTTTRSPSLLDISENPHNIKFLEIDAAMLPRTLSDVTFAVIPTNFALQGGLSPQEDALAMETRNSPYANILVIHEEDIDREDLKALKQALTSEKMAQFINERYQGAVIPAFTPSSEDTSS